MVTLDMGMGLGFIIGLKTTDKPPKKQLETVLNSNRVGFKVIVETHSRIPVSGFLLRGFSKQRVSLYGFRMDDCRRIMDAIKNY